jgi:hypothetical protein
MAQSGKNKKEEDGCRKYVPDKTISPIRYIKELTRENAQNSPPTLPATQ